MKRARKVVLAYSGGVDTTACIPYLKHEWGCEEVVALTADLGQGAELGPIHDKALSPHISVRPDGADDQWRKDPPRQLTV